VDVSVLEAGAHSSKRFLDALRVAKRRALEFSHLLRREVPLHLALQFIVEVLARGELGRVRRKTGDLDPRLPVVEPRARSLGRAPIPVVENQEYLATRVIDQPLREQGKASCAFIAAIA
jgi:hypothetical protein